MHRPFFKSLTGKLTGILIAGAAIGGLFFVFLYTVMLNGMDYYFSNSAYLEKEEQNVVRNLQTFISRNQLSSEDTADLTKWVKRQEVAYLLIYKDDLLVYDSTYEQKAVYSENTMPQYDWMTSYPVQFADGETEVCLYGVYEYKFYMYMLIGIIVASLFLFFLIFIFGIKKEVNYIQELEEDVHLMEGGYMEKPLRIKGQDELSMLADGLEHMRISFQENIQMEEKLTHANRSLITGMSHDLRTPLTALFVYLEILQSSEAKDEQAKKHYVEKALEKAMQIKMLSDQLFEFFLISKDDRFLLEAPQLFRSVFMDYLSELVMFLESQEFHVVSRLNWQPVELEVRMDFIGRIMDNVSSNMLKYASAGKCVYISTVYEEQMAGIMIENSIAQPQEDVESTKLGITNIRLMMEKMNGICEVKETADTYTMTLKFPVKQKPEIKKISS